MEEDEKIEGLKEEGELCYMFGMLKSHNITTKRLIVGEGKDWIAGWGRRGGLSTEASW